MTSINAASNAAALFQISSSSDGKTQAEKALAGVADLLGMNTDELNVAQENNVTLAQLAKEKGVDANKLHDALVEGLKENAPSGVSANTDFGAMATSIIDGTAAKDAESSTSPTSWWQSEDANNSSNRLADLLSQHGVTQKNLADYLDGASNGDSSLFDTGESDAGSDFYSQLQSLVSQYGSKGNAYDSKA